MLTLWLASKLVERVKRIQPGARINGVTVQRMANARRGREIYIGLARVRATRIGISRLKDISQRVKDAIDAQALVFDADGWAELDVPVEEDTWSAREMTRVGAEVEVLAPQSLRDRMADIARRLATSYGLI